MSILTICELVYGCSKNKHLTVTVACNPLNGTDRLSLFVEIKSHLLPQIDLTAALKNNYGQYYSYTNHQSESGF